CLYRIRGRSRPAMSLLSSSNSFTVLYERTCERAAKVGVELGKVEGCPSTPLGVSIGCVIGLGASPADRSNLRAMPAEASAKAGRANRFKSSPNDPYRFAPFPWERAGVRGSGLSAHVPLALAHCQVIFFLTTDNCFLTTGTA